MNPKLKHGFALSVADKVSGSMDLMATATETHRNKNNMPPIRQTNRTSQSAKKVLTPLLAKTREQMPWTAPDTSYLMLPQYVERPDPYGSLQTNMRGSRPTSLPEERLQRCRERNRIHARKTRLRKKEHSLRLQQRADELKQHQLRLKQIINEKNTASILLGFASSNAVEDGTGNSVEDPRVEELLRRPSEEIPDSTKIPELPALILPGQHASKKAKAESDALVKKVQEELPSEGFDLELLAKDRSTCSPEELDQIRRERNRMHAKRTRERKRLFMEEMGEICRQLEEENDMLRDHLRSIDPDFEDEHEFDSCATDDVSDISLLTPVVSRPVTYAAASKMLLAKRKEEETVSSSPSEAPAKRQKVSSGNHLQYLLEAAFTYEMASNSSAASTSPPQSPSGDSASSALFAIAQAINNETSPKRRRETPTTLSAATAVGC